MGKIVRLGFGILIPSTTKGLNSLVLSMSLWCHRAWAKSETWIWDFDTLTYERSRITGFVNVPVMPESMGKIVRLGFGILIPSTTKGLGSQVLSMFLWCHRAFGKIVRLGFGILIPSPTKGLGSLVLSMFLWCPRAWAKSWDLDLGFWYPQLRKV